ncbi:hypothetical protein NBRC110019_17780 [Neptunitalea chrysea]|uniref:AAA+ ATPase domain-containing protein n=1 Tax=Neptunitalea chrysea TaxID=1647581 RepID=A0A9W6B8E2_9FLAO|nr:AAA family ATPase [Neptunitalea chrysea]GLB52738.1 hypothetical protein NBRC110019_17780 [Neptunitalea chrysea]
MSGNHSIEDLLEALKYSPDNSFLRLMLAKAYLDVNELDEAEKQFSQILQNGKNMDAMAGLAKVYFRKENYSACNVIVEELLETSDVNEELLVLYAKGLLHEGEIGRATEIYKEVLHKNPSFTDPDLDGSLRVASSYFEGDDEDDVFMEKPSVKFHDVGGMDAVKKEIDLKIIKPLQHADLYKAYGKKTGGGILLYGPPGCGKTFIAKATAGEVNAKFLSLELNDILDMWIGNSEKNLHEIFETGRHNTPCVLFIDEIDALGASRTDMKGSGGRNVINQFLQELDGVDNDNDGLLILGATNTPWNLDNAFRRPGRFDRIIFVPPPDAASRAAILKLKLKDKPAEGIDYEKVAKATEHYSGADIDAIIDIAIEEKLEASFTDGVPKPLQTNDLLKAVKRHKSTTKEWFKTAKNFAMFANDSGLYDDILTYLKKMK